MTDHAISAIGWIVVGITAIVFIGSQLNHWLWCWHGRVLSREFDALCRERETEVDPLVMDPTVVDDEKRVRIEDILERFEEHAQRRAEWAKRSWLS